MILKQRLITHKGDLKDKFQRKYISKCVRYKTTLKGILCPLYGNRNHLNLQINIFMWHKWYKSIAVICLIISNFAVIITRYDSLVDIVSIHRCNISALIWNKYNSTIHRIAISSHLFHNHIGIILVDKIHHLRSSVIRQGMK